MNYTEVVVEVMQQTGIEQGICEEVMNAYEAYCTKAKRLPFKKSVDDEMISWICSQTSYHRNDVKRILESLLLIVRNGIKSKLLCKS